MGSFGIPGLGALVSATMHYWYGAPTEAPQNGGTTPLTQNEPEDDEERVAPPPLRPMVTAATDTSVEPEELDVPLPPDAKKKKKKKNKKKSVAAAAPEIKGVAPAIVTPIEAPPVVVAVKPPPIVKLSRAMLGAKLQDMIKPPVGEEGSKILFFLDHVLHPGDVPVALGEHLVTYKIQDADGSVSPEEHCTTIKILFDTDKLMRKMGFQRMGIGYIRRMTQMHAGTSHNVHITVPYNSQHPPTSLKNWSKDFDGIYAGIFPQGEAKFSGIHVTYELATGMNNSGYYPRDGWKTARGMQKDQDELQSAVCKKAAKDYMPSLSPDLKKALGETAAEFEASVTAALAPHVALGVTIHA